VEHLAEQQRPVSRDIARCLEFRGQLESRLARISARCHRRTL